MAIAVAIVGLGLRGGQWVEALRRTPGYALAACVDVDGPALHRAAAALGIPESQRFLSLEDALDATHPQAVIVATTIDSHVSPSETVLARRIPLLVEKPFALTLREARSLTALAASAGVPLIVGQTYRHTGMAQTLRRLLRSGMVGRTGLIVYQVYRGNVHLRAAVAALPYGILWETGVHHIDLLRYLLGQEIVAVHAEGFALPWSQLGPGASINVSLTFVDGTRAVLVATYDSRPASTLRITGERGTLVPWRRWVFFTGRGRLPRLVATAGHRNPETALLGQLARAIRTGEDPESSGRDNLQTIAALEACARSATDRRTVNPQDLFGEPF